MIKIFLLSLALIPLISCVNDATSYRYRGANWTGTCSTVRMKHLNIFIYRDKTKVQLIYLQRPILFWAPLKCMLLVHWTLPLIKLKESFRDNILTNQQVVHSVILLKHAPNFQDIAVLSGPRLMDFLLAMYVHLYKWTISHTL